MSECVCVCECMYCVSGACVLSLTWCVNISDAQKKPQAQGKRELEKRTMMMKRARRKQVRKFNKKEEQLQSSNSANQPHHRLNFKCLSMFSQNTNLQSVLDTLCQRANVVMALQLLHELQKKKLKNK